MDSDDQRLLPIGTAIGDRYEIVSVLGVGGMGAVFRCRDRNTFGKEVAVKTLVPEMMANREAHARMAREAEMVSRINHPNLVQLLDFGTFEGAPFIVMDLLTGHDLGAVLEREGRLAIDRAADHMLGMCSGVAEAHGRGIIHRDLKPANVFVCTTLHGEQVKVLDFGVSKPLRSGDITGSSMIIGTVAYMAPEQARGGEVDARVDQYALGVVLYEMLTGTLPYEGATQFELLEATVRGRVVPPRVRRADIPGGLEAIVLKAMSLRREDRYQSVHQLGAALIDYASEVGRVLYTRYYTRSIPGGLILRPKATDPVLPAVPPAKAGGTELLPTPAAASPQLREHESVKTATSRGADREPRSAARRRVVGIAIVLGVSACVFGVFALRRGSTVVEKKEPGATQSTLPQPSTRGSDGPSTSRDAVTTRFVEPPPEEQKASEPPRQTTPDRIRSPRSRGKQVSSRQKRKKRTEDPTTPMETTKDGLPIVH